MFPSPAPRAAESTGDLPRIVLLETSADPLGAFTSESEAVVTPAQRPTIHQPRREATAMGALNASPSAAAPSASTVRVRVRLPGWVGTSSLAIVAGALSGLTMAATYAASRPDGVEVAAATAAESAAAPDDVLPALPLAASVVRCVPTLPPAMAPAAPTAVPASPDTARGHGGTIARPVPSAPPAPSGWLTVASPFPVRVLVDGDAVGTSTAPGLPVPAGSHTIALVNEALEFTETRTMEVAAHRTFRVAIETPVGALHLNAEPWAQVWIDGRRMGETPLANVALPIGEHEVVLRHPDLGEQRRTVVVGARTPVYLGVELTR